MGKITLLLSLVFFVGCTSSTVYTTKGSTPRKQHALYTTQAQTSEQQVEAKGKVYRFVTSYYGKKFQGKPTSSGEIFDMYKLTCAHKTLPFGTLLKVTNEDNGLSVVVKVNDRGPFVDGRDLDISYAAAQKIGLVGVGVKTMKVEVIDQ